MVRKFCLLLASDLPPGKFPILQVLLLHSGATLCVSFPSSLWAIWGTWLVPPNHLSPGRTSWCLPCFEWRSKGVLPFKSFPTSPDWWGLLSAGPLRVCHTRQLWSSYVLLAKAVLEPMLPGSRKKRFLSVRCFLILRHYQRQQTLIPKKEGKALTDTLLLALALSFSKNAW